MPIFAKRRIIVERLVRNVSWIARSQPILDDLQVKESLLAGEADFRHHRAACTADGFDDRFGPESQPTRQPGYRQFFVGPSRIKTGSGSRLRCVLLHLRMERPCLEAFIPNVVTVELIEQEGAIESSSH